MARKTSEEAQQTREKILMGALNVFSEKGFSRTTLRDIARHIGMTRGAVYWHFKDKRDLLVELMGTMQRREDKLLAEKVPQIRSLDDLLAQFMVRVDMVENDPEIRKFVNLMSLQVEWGTEREVFTGIHENNLRVTPFRHIPDALALAREQDEIRPDADLGQVFDILVGLFTGIMRNHLTGIAKRPVRSTLEPALRAVFDSIRNHQASPNAESSAVSQ